MTIRTPTMIALIAYLVVVSVLLGLFLLGHGRRLSPAVRSKERTLKHSFFQSQVRTFHRRIDEMARPGSVLFIGASGIQGMDVHQICDKALNFGIGGDTTAGVLERLPGYTSLDTARAVILSIGFNDLRISPNPEILANFQKILDSIPENVSVIVCSLVEVDENEVGRGTNERVNGLNSRLGALCSQRERTTFFDLNQSLHQHFRGSLEGCHEPDGCHLNLAGRRFWSDEIRRLLSGIREVS